MRSCIYECALCSTAVDFEVMSINTQRQVACEFGYPEQLVNDFLRKKRYRNAGDLVDDLEDYLLKFENGLPEEKDDDEKAASYKEDIAVVNFPIEDKDSDATTVAATAAAAVSSSTTAPRKLTLYKETVLLYKRSKCLVCLTNRRCVVTLPCSHLSLCNTCLLRTRKCPLRDCGERIESGIQTYD